MAMLNAHYLQMHMDCDSRNISRHLVGRRRRYTADGKLHKRDFQRSQHFT